MEKDRQREKRSWMANMECKDSSQSQDQMEEEREGFMSKIQILGFYFVMFVGQICGHANVLTPSSTARVSRYGH